MVSATAFAILLQLPTSPLAGWTTSEWLARLPMGIAMGLTAAALIYSPPGRRSGAHMNPAVTLAFLRLGKISLPDAVAYVVAQFIGAAVGIGLTIPIFHGLAGNPSVNYVATAPGINGSLAAFGGEVSMSFLLMLTVLFMSNTTRVARFTGVAAAGLVAAFIVIEAPLSGMSMNPARSFGSAIFAHSAGLWIYFTAPPLGMLAATEAYHRMVGRARVRCAKLHHPRRTTCIFSCGYLETP